MRAVPFVLALALGGCAGTSEPLREPITMPVEEATDTLRVIFERAEFDAASDVLRLAGRVLVRGPQLGGEQAAIGAQITLRPPDQTEAGFLPFLMRKPLVALSAGREGAFEFGVATPDPGGYTAEFGFAGAFPLVLPVDSVLSAR